MSTEKPVALKPCPFCGHDEIDPREWMAGDGSHGPGCPECGALADSVDEWNRRVEHPTLAPEDVRRIAEKWAMEIVMGQKSKTEAIQAAIIEALGGKNV